MTRKRKKKIAGKLIVRMSSSDIKLAKERGASFSKPNTMVQWLSKNLNVKIPAKNRSAV